MQLKEQPFCIVQQLYLIILMLLLSAGLLEAVFS